MNISVNIALLLALPLTASPSDNAIHRPITALQPNAEMAETEQLLGRIGREVKKARDRKKADKKKADPINPTEEQRCKTARNDSSSLRGLIGDAGREIGLSEFDDILNNDFSDVLVDEIACQLTKEEQAVAAEATKKVTEKEEVGATAEWQSPERQGVSGSSTVTAVNTRPSGGKCMTITDIAIIDGEETRVQKRMCRSDGEKAYVLEA